MSDLSPVQNKVKKRIHPRQRKKELPRSILIALYLPVALGLVVGFSMGWGSFWFANRPMPDYGIPPSQHTDLPKTIHPKGVIPSPVIDDTSPAIPTPDLFSGVTPSPSPFGPESHILEYHYVRTGVDQQTDPIGYNLSVSPTQLDSEVAAMQAAGYTSETMADYSAGKGGVKTILMTFDDGYEDFYTDAYPILKKYGWTATIYIISGKVGEPSYMTWSQLRELKADGIEIGAHTVNHIDLATATPAQQRYQIFGSQAAIETQVGGTVTAFCYPSGDYTPLTEVLVKAAGFTSSTTEHTGGIHHTDDPFQLDRIRVSPGESSATFLNRITSQQ